MNIVVQPGHVNIKYNCNTALRKGTGAPGEAVWTQKMVSRLCELLREDGHTVVQTDANANCDPAITQKDWDLCLSCHTDANIYGTGGGFVDTQRADWDGAASESARIAQCIRDRYFTETGIVNHPERSNVNTKEYYLFSEMSPKTPGVLIECGILADPHDSVILNDIERVAKGIREGIRKAFPPIVVEPPTDPCSNLRDEVSRLNKELLNSNLDRDKALNSQKTLLTENADLKRKLIDITKVINS